MKKLDLDVNTPEEVAQVLRTTAEAYYETTSDLQSAWTSKTAGKVWSKIARVLEQAANRIEKIVNEN